MDSLTRQTTKTVTVKDLDIDSTRDRDLEETYKRLCFDDDGIMTETMRLDYVRIIYF